MPFETDLWRTAFKEYDFNIKQRYNCNIDSSNWPTVLDEPLYRDCPPYTDRMRELLKLGAPRKYRYDTADSFFLTRTLGETWINLEYAKFVIDLFDPKQMTEKQ